MNQEVLGATPQWQSFVETLEALAPGDVLDGGFKLLGPAKFKGAQADLWIAERSGASFVAKFYRSKDGYVPPPANIPDHPNIVGISGNGEFKGRPFEISPFHPEGSIDSFAKRTPLTAADAEAVLADMCRGLGALHKVGIQHRDLKPANLLVISKQPLKIGLADFGSAGHSFTTTLTGVKGTLLYSAPEATDGQYSPKSDLWSLGVIFLELLYGKHPLEGMDSFQQSYAVKAGLIPIPKDLSPKHRRIVEGLLEKASSDRLNCDQVLGILNGEEVPQSKTSTTSAQKRQAEESSGGGISLIEITVAMGLVVILVSVGVFGVSSMKSKMKHTEALNAVLSIDHTLQMYRAAEEKHTIADDTVSETNLYDTRDPQSALRYIHDIKAGLPTTAGLNVQLDIPDNNPLWDELKDGKARLEWTGQSPEKQISLVEIDTTKKR